MKSFITILLFAAAVVPIVASVTVRNVTASVAYVATQPVAANSTVALDLSSSVVDVDYGARSVTVEIIDGAHVTIDDVQVTVAVPRSVYLEILWYGFCFGIGCELFGLLIRVVRAVRSNTGEVL